MHSQSPDTDAPEKPSATSWYGLALLIGIYTMHAVNRNVAATILEPLKLEFHLSDGQVSALTVFMNAIGIALASIPLGVLADRKNRVRLISLFAAIWSTLSFVCGLATNAMTLLVARFGVGAAEGGFSPSALSLLWDYFPRNRRGTALGLFYTSTAFGTGASYLLGTYVASHWGWRYVFFFAGLPGLILALILLFTLPEPKRGRFDLKPRLQLQIASVGEIFRYMGKTKSIIYAIIGIALTVMMISSFWSWTISFLVRTHGMNPKTGGMILFIATAPLQALAMVITGPIADRYARGRPGRAATIPVIAQMVALPIAIVALYSPNTTVVTIGLLAFGFVVGIFTAQIFGMVLTFANPRMRGSAMGFTHFVANIGTGTGPVLTGILSDMMGGQGYSIGNALFIVVLLLIPAAGFLLLASRRGAEEALEEARLELRLS